MNELERLQLENQLLQDKLNSLKILVSDLQHDLDQALHDVKRISDVVNLGG